MDVPHSTHPFQIPTFDTAALRENYLISGLFLDDQLTPYYFHEDRVVPVGVKPVNGRLAIPAFCEIRCKYFFECRERGWTGLLRGFRTVELVDSIYAAKAGC